MRDLLNEWTELNEQGVVRDIALTGDQHRVSRLGLFCAFVYLGHRIAIAIAIALLPVSNNSAF